MKWLTRRLKRRIRHEFRPESQLLEDRRIMTVVFQGQGQLVEVLTDSTVNAREITVFRDGAAVAAGNQITVSHDVSGNNTDFRRSLVLDTNGSLRLRHLDGATAAGREDSFGTTIKLPPGIRASGGSFLTARVDRIELLTGFSTLGTLAIKATGRPANDVSSNNPQVLPVAVDWDLIFPRPTNAETTVRLTTMTRFENDVILDDIARNNAEAFRAIEYSSSYVPATHSGLGVVTRDADQFRTTANNGAIISTLDLNSTAPNQLFFPSVNGSLAGSAFNGGLELNQLIPAPPNGDPPNIRSHLVPDGADYRGQGFITLNSSTNVNSDNLGAWAGRTFAASRIPAGSRLGWTVKISATETPTPYRNSLPTLSSLGSAVTLAAGGALNRASGFSDPDDADVWAATVDYGDGTGSRPLTLNVDKTFQLSRVYAQPGAYQVVVRVFDDEGAVGSATLDVLVRDQPPTGLSAVAENSRARLAWTDNAIGETRYRVERGLDQINWQVIAASLPANSTTYDDVTVVPGAAYFYRVFAEGPGGLSDPSNVAMVRVPEATASVQFSQSVYSVNERQRRALIEIVRTGPATGALQVRFSAFPQTARAGSDFRPFSRVIRFAPNQTRAVVTVMIVNDNRPEPVKTIRLALAKVSGPFAIGPRRSAQLVLEDDDS